MLKALFLTLFINSFLFANCKYNLHINFDFKNNLIDVKTHIKSHENIHISLKNFEVENKKSLQDKLQKGVNEISFSYTKEIKDLNKQFIYLLQSWYPIINTKCSYKIKTNLSNEYKIIYENTSKQIDYINFIASKKFVVNEENFRDISIKTFFLRDDKELVKKYMNKMKEYIVLYENILDKYPYKEFKIVENIYQTGYSMPTYTLIGSRLLNKDYILNQSLGHEYLHQYFGNSVFNNFKKGNWTEGLTNYLADEYYKRGSQEASKSRKNILNQFDSFVNKKEFAIKDFQYRYDKNSSLIGYSKLAFVFHMLENKIGKDKFFNLIKKFYKNYKFKEANLKDLEEFFNKNTKEDLSLFFKQWFYKKGKIDFKVENISFEKNILELKLKQKPKNIYHFNLPIYIKTKTKVYKKLIQINKQVQTIQIKLHSKPQEIILDKNYDLFRALFKDEKIYTIGKLLTLNNLLAIVDKKDLKNYDFIKSIFPKAKIIYTKDVNIKDLKNQNILLLNSSNKFIHKFFENININNKNSYIKVIKNKYNKNKTMAILHKGLYKARYLSMLKHYSQYSTVILNKGKTIKEINKTKNGIVLKLKN